MTLLAGIICKDGVVMAADSQTTIGSRKQTGTEKITVVNCGGNPVLIAVAGSVVPSSRAVTIFQSKTARMTVTNEESIANAVTESVREVRKDQMDLGTNGWTSLDAQSFFEKEINYFELLFAYYFKGEPFLYSVNALWCLPVKATKFFEVCGTGSDLASYILGEEAMSGMEIDLACAMAIYTVGKVNKHNLYCSGDMRVGVLTPFPRNLFPSTDPLFPSAWIWQSEDVTEVAEIIRGLDKDNQEDRRKELSRSLNARTQTKISEMLNAPHPLEENPNLY
ncbi:MAG: Ntn hydrolase family protein [Limisphaerales bacterium]